MLRDVRPSDTDGAAQMLRDVRPCAPPPLANPLEMTVRSLTEENQRLKVVLSDTRAERDAFKDTSEAQVSALKERLESAKHELEMAFLTIPPLIIDSEVAPLKREVEALNKQLLQANELLDEAAQRHTNDWVHASLQQQEVQRLRGKVAEGDSARADLEKRVAFFQHELNRVNAALKEK